MKTLTEKQLKMLEFIEDFQERENMSPTVYEIAEHFDIKTSTVFAHLKALQRKNQLSRTSKARSISLRSSRKPLHNSFALPIPLLGRINAGWPADSVAEKIGEVVIPSEMAARNDAARLFALKVSGESMRDLGIYDDDVVIVKPTDVLRSGDIVVALVGDEVTIKSYFPLKDNRLELRPANVEYTTQIYPAGSVRIQGKVIGLQREY